MKIVPWKPIRDVIALQLWPEIVQSRRIAKSSAKETPATPVIILGGPFNSSPPSFEFQTGENRPSPSVARGQKNKSVVALPTLVSASSMSTPLTQSSVRRSRRRSNKEGYCTVRLANVPSKKRKASVVMIDEATGQTGLVPISVLQGWGINCGVAPSELTKDALMQAPNDQVANDDATA